MTNEQAIKWLKDYRKTTDFTMPQYEEALDMAIKALEQEPILNKIRAEISENIEAFSMSDWETNNILADGLQMALNIIDGYREGANE